MNETEDRPVCSDRIHAGLEDSGVIQAVQEYLTALEAGYKPDRQQFLARYSRARAGPGRMFGCPGVCAHGGAPA